MITEEHMKKYIVAFLLILAFFPAFVSAKPNNPEFIKFYKRQDSLCVVAYRQRDTASFNKLIVEILTKYHALDEKDQKTFSQCITNEYYNLCCIYSLNNEKEKALDLLEKAINAGYFNYSHMVVDKDLDNIRNEARYVKLTLPMRNVGDFIFILKKAEKYNNADNRPLPPFTYQTADNPGLSELRKAFHLDSIAGSGNDVSKVLNVMHWLHNFISHDGMYENPPVKNAKEMIAYCRQHRTGLNCRGLATVLNECYLSLGFKSRFVTCLPKDSLHIDPDCHVINMVYINKLNKWVWVDPTNDAYVMDEKGNLLSIEEVRERLVNGKTLILNPDANWNHKTSTIKDEYLYSYMAKNLYMIECPASSQYDTETAKQGKTVDYIKLIPLDYFSQKPDKSQETGKSGLSMINYNTNNSSLFWAKP
jgi:hypothetical protein